MLILLSGIFGFYGGRYYEQRDMRSRFQQRGNFGERFYGSGGSAPRSDIQRDRIRFSDRPEFPMGR